MIYQAKFSVRIAIPLTQGKEAFIDVTDLPLVQSKKWQALRIRDDYYAVHGYWNGKGSSLVYMHRLIMGATKGMSIDHRDHNPLNNARSNLRFATQSQNLANSRKSRVTTS